MKTKKQKSRTQKPRTADCVSRIADTEEGTRLLFLLCSASVTRRPDLVRKALEKLFAYALGEKQKREKKQKETNAREEKPLKVIDDVADIPAEALIRNTTPPADAYEATSDYIQQVIVPGLRQGQLIYTTPTRWKGRPLSAFYEHWETLLQKHNAFTGRLTLQVANNRLVVNLQGIK